MREINALVVHCSATPPARDIGVAEIRKWHVEGNGWQDVGYHYIIRRDGRVEAGRSITRAGAHVSGHNAKTIGICLVGGVDAVNRPVANYTEDQWQSLALLITTLRERYPKAELKGHRDYPGVKKACPCFDVKTWAAGQGLV